MSAVYPYGDRPSLWNIMSRVLNATGFTKLHGKINIREYQEVSNETYYPSTPASNALRLSSRDDMPVNARIRVSDGGTDLGDSCCFRFDSNSRIFEVAPTPIVA